ncbi:GNAT family N-acetyltransferase [Nocardioides marmoriginsengisoli]|uniref:GNAT family N-acetyltransferase n=1 Tax=Nocardioides marmoriginsengisoli TaxID=661483 RepID=A0A3N0CNP6_9ACTN|nr:GNAT family N-acetyltransferase [Nocardioides marmoriginsengisoli]RNL64939.1 GNAT family N-acetyltransferase [Nocardioides marmoriginsengisoli]
MSRHSLEIRDARPDDAPELLHLWVEAGGRNAEQPQPRPVDEAVSALAQVAADPDERVVVGLYEGKLVAAIHLRRTAMSPLHTDVAVHTSYLLVTPEHRKHGFARALLDVAVTWAEEKDITHITAITASTSRDTNRFLARLGLATVASVRVASTATLRRKLTPESLRPQDSRRNLGALLAQRRTMQRRARADESEDQAD